MVVVSRDEMSARLSSLRARLLSSARLRVAESRRRFERARTDRALREAASRLRQGMQRSDELQARLRAAMAAAGRAARHRLERDAGRLSALSPLAVLARGYAICTIPDGGIVRDARALAPGDPVRVHLHRGRLRCDVKEVEDVPAVEG
jgi:exodeoxyribonuclease VII large subunit